MSRPPLLSTAAPSHPRRKSDTECCCENNITGLPAQLASRLTWLRASSAALRSQTLRQKQQAVRREDSPRACRSPYKSGNLGKRTTDILDEAGCWRLPLEYGVRRVVRLRYRKSILLLDAAFRGGYSNASSLIRRRFGEARLRRLAGNFQEKVVFPKRTQIKTAHLFRCEYVR
jgi:hypothetical protein